VEEENREENAVQQIFEDLDEILGEFSAS